MKKTRGAGPKYHARRLVKLYAREQKLREVREQMEKGLIEPKKRKPFTWRNRSALG